MFCVVFVFSCILQVLEEKPIKFQDYNEVSKLTFGWIQFQSILNLRKEKLAKIRYFRKESKMSTSQ
jgi:hypothetical protein